MYQNKKIFIFGMAKSGYECAKLLADKNEVLITDQKEQDSTHIEELKSKNVKVEIIENAIEI